MNDLNLFRVKGSVYLREISSKVEVLADLDCPQRDNSGEPDGFLIRSSEKVARSIIASLRDRQKVGSRKYMIGIYGGDDAFNRRVIETLGIDYLVSPEGSGKVDGLKQRDSGLNHVVVGIAARRGVRVVVDFGEVASLKGKRKAERIARIMQNVKICRRAGCLLKIASLGRDKKGVVDEKGRRAFGVGLGMSSGEVRDCVKF